MAEIVIVRIVEHETETNLDNGLEFVVDSENYLDEIPKKVSIGAIRDYITTYLHTSLARAGKDIPLTGGIENTVNYTTSFEVTQTYVLVVQTYSVALGQVGFVITEENLGNFKITPLDDCLCKYVAVPTDVLT